MQLLKGIIAAVNKDNILTTSTMAPLKNLKPRTYLGFEVFLLKLISRPLLIVLEAGSMLNRL